MWVQKQSVPFKQMFMQEEWKLLLITLWVYDPATLEIQLTEEEEQDEQLTSESESEEDYSDNDDLDLDTW